MNKKIEAYDKVLELIDRLLRDNGRSNVFMRSNIEELRNSVVELQTQEEEKDEEKNEKEKKSN